MCESSLRFAKFFFRENNRSHCQRNARAITLSSSCEFSPPEHAWLNA